MKRTDKKSVLITLVYLVVVVFFGRILFILPDDKFSGILNTDHFYTVSCALSVICLLPIYFFGRRNRLKAALINLGATLLVFLAVGLYYYANLPLYTYEQAAFKVENAEREAGKNVRAYMPEHHEDKVVTGQGSYFLTTNSRYMIFLKELEDMHVYKFNPLDGRFELYEGQRNFTFESPSPGTWCLDNRLSTGGLRGRRA